MDTFTQWLIGEDRASMPTVYQETVMPDTTHEKKITDKLASASRVKRNRSLEDTDIATLQENYGELTPGRTITIELQEACKLLCRTRMRIDAFAKLKKVLHEQYKVELIITSRKTHYGKD